MATISITIPNPVVNRVIDAMCNIYSYQPIINGQPNPITKQEFARLQLIKFMKEAVRKNELPVIENNQLINLATQTTALDTDINAIAIT